MKKIKNRIKFLKNYDLFGHPITLTMKQGSTYKSVFGGVVSLIIEIVFLLLVLYSLIQLFSNKNLTISRDEINLGKSFGSLSLPPKELNFALKFDQDSLNNWTLPFINISLIHVTQYRNETNIFKVKNKISLNVCEIENFKGVETDFKLLGLENALCPNFNSSILIQGSYEEKVFSYFQIKLTICEEKEKCQDNETLFEEMNKIGFFL